MELRTLLIDNYDSYTYNLFQLIAEVNGALPTVLRNDEVSWPELEHRIAAGEWHNIVISPGPGTPEREADVGLSLALLCAQPHIPILGVCLGFQALALAHGGAITHAPEPVHGRLSAIAHSGHPLFEGIPSGRRYAVVRYHSLLVDEASLPSCLEPLAWTCGGHHALQLGTDEDAAGSDSSSSGSGGSSTSCCGSSPGRGERLLMALAHRSLPHFGVQFHPESVATGFGAALLRNFAALTWRFHGQPMPPLPPHLAGKLPGPPGSAMPPRPWEQPAGNLRVQYSHLPGLLAAAGGSEGLFWSLFGGSRSGSDGSSGGNCFADGCCRSGGQPGSDPAADTFWLDSATPDRGRFSFMGGRGGSLWRRVEYRLPPVAAAAAADSPNSVLQQAASANGTAAHANGSSEAPQGTLVLTAADSSEQRIATDFFGWLQGLLASHRCRVSPEDAASLPFDFWGGLVGYLGYELKAECGGHAVHASPTPDAAFLLADQLVAVDHHTDSVYVLALYESSSTSSQQEAQQWVDRTAARVQALAAARQAVDAADAAAGRPAANGSVLQPQANGVSQAQAVRGSAEQPPAAKQQQKQQLAERPAAGAFQLREGRQRYLKNVASCMQALYDGESYEVCLTTMLSRRGSVPPAHQLYRTLRCVNPAPYAAWLRFGGGADALQLCCCSPERFLRGGRGGLLEAKPIKGTAPRSSDPAQDAHAAAELAASEKDRAENLMIVDLLRNDLGRVCEPGSVHVPALMHIESYATVHQMVSTVRGLRRPGASIVDCLRAAFPGGSMTGAPKIRTMEIIDQLEQGPRGVYSGSLGFISFNDTFDLNIVIRTAVLHGDKLSIGAGGAIVVQSDPEGEYEEMRLKARALLRAIGECDGGGGGPAAVDEE
ncbi:aminodeoxychorismate chloroplastic [Chlorella sorokiniana]|uniref:aminodeoxychorismate synthase n=1 Tax=Chlorella sorokiniana TaxID=3076 RepID=A0A2P6TYE0_CHLSO|nr:aminodeoxychorismate chloroplastic [Chlorella sorokiniana]|eukprot:PRW59076.1 aminodeoxychorismate chloroplastic [Chlorella sorokiniana]